MTSAIGFASRPFFAVLIEIVSAVLGSQPLPDTVRVIPFSVAVTANPGCGFGTGVFVAGGCRVGVAGGGCGGGCGGCVGRGMAVSVGIGVSVGGSGTGVWSRRDRFVSWGRRDGPVSRCWRMSRRHWRVGRHRRMGWWERDGCKRRRNRLVSRRRRRCRWLRRPSLCWAPCRPGCRCGSRHWLLGRPNSWCVGRRKRVRRQRRRSGRQWGLCGQ